MKKNKIAVFALAFFILLLSFFHGTPSDEKVQESPIANIEVTQQTPQPAQTPEIATKNNKTPSQETYKEETEYHEDEPMKTEEPVADEPDELSCTLLVRCDEVLNNMDLLSEEKRRIIPQDGIIYPKESVEFSDGESVFDILLRALREKEIHLEFVDTPMYNSVYIEGIGNLYEFDCGDMSGWQYRVNGIKPNYGSSEYKVKNGDSIEFYYTTNFMENK